MNELLKFALSNGASDCFFSTGKPFSLRIKNDIVATESEPLTAEMISLFRRQVLGAEQEMAYVKNSGADASWQIESGERFRFNFFETMNGPAAVARPIKNGSELYFSALSLPEKLMSEISSAQRGIIIIAGTTGSGKSTTLGAIINYINENFRKHILTLEDPVEFIHSDKYSIVNQREINSGSNGFSNALKNAMRENPDVIVVGEMRDTETMTAAITCAQTGHLVITTAHTTDAVQTVERIINMFPESVRDQLALDLSMMLNSIIVQRLLPTQDKQTMIPALEIMRNTPSIKKHLANREYSLLEENIKNGSGDGMINFNHSLFQLYKDGIITFETACQASDNVEELKLLKSGMSSGRDTFTKNYSLSADSSRDGIGIKTLLHTAVKHGASDLLLTCNAPPMLRINGSYCSLALPPLTEKDVRHLLISVVSKHQRVELEERKELDFSLSITHPAKNDQEQDAEHRFRMNAFYQRGALALVARVIPDRIPEPSELGLPPVLLNLIKKKQGLILFTGPTGSGKSTTMASLLNVVNKELPVHIITIEDPIEYVHKNNCAIVEQRELGQDTLSFANALRAAMREAPDIILVGEMRDTETISAALTAAETGHLVIGTIHTNSAMQTVDRIIDSFPAQQQNQVRQQFAASLLGVISQRLLKRADANGRIAAFEIMVGTPAIQALIRENKTHLLQSTIETAAKDGMVTLDKALNDLYEAGKISEKDLTLFKADHKAVNAF